MKKDYRLWANESKIQGRFVYLVISLDENFIQPENPQNLPSKNVMKDNITQRFKEWFAQFQVNYQVHRILAAPDVTAEGKFILAVQVTILPGLGGNKILAEGKRSFMEETTKYKFDYASTPFLNNKYPMNAFIAAYGKDVYGFECRNDGMMMELEQKEIEALKNFRGEGSTDKDIGEEDQSESEKSELSEKAERPKRGKRGKKQQEHVEIQENEEIEVSADRFQDLLNQFEALRKREELREKEMTSLREEINVSIRTLREEKDKEIRTLREEKDGEIRTLTERVRTFRDLLEEFINKTFDHSIRLSDQESKVGAIMRRAGGYDAFE